MEIKSYADATAKEVADTFNKIQEFNLVKESIYKSILKAYEDKDVQLLESSIKDAKRIVDQQKIFFDKLYKSINLVYAELLRQIKIINDDTGFFRKFLSNDEQFTRAVDNSIITGLEDMKSSINDQVKVLDAIKGKDSLRIFFKLKSGLNDLYKDEVYNFFYINDAYKNLEFEAYKKYLEKRLDAYIEELHNKDKLGRARKTVINNCLSAIAFVVFFIDVFRKIKIKDGWLNKLYEKIDLISENLPENDSDSGINISANILVQSQAMHTIISH